jgi:serine/threonine-protein kinase
VLQLGEIIERKYQVLRRHGEGGMGIVFEGQCLDTGRRVAIKVMRAHLLAERDLVMRFEREAAAAARVDSAHVVRVLDGGDLPSGDRYMVMEFLEGESLHARLKARSWLSPEETAGICVQLLDGLSRVHAAGILHRDLKPHNIFLLPSARAADFVKILDFGACKILTPKRGDAPDLRTSAGNLFGTVPYMAPECFQDDARGLDPRADIYSTGVIIYRCVTGTLPFRANTVFEMLIHLREGRAVKLREVMPDVDPAFAQIVDRATALTREARFQSADQLRSALLDWMGATSRLSELIEFLEDSREQSLYREGDHTLRPVTVPPKVRDLAPTLHAEEEVARIAATLAPEPDEGTGTSRIHVQPGVAPQPAGISAAARKALPTMEEIPIHVDPLLDAEPPEPAELPGRDVHDDGNTVEMRTIMKKT